MQHVHLRLKRESESSHIFASGQSDYIVYFSAFPENFVSYILTVAAQQTQIVPFFSLSTWAIFNLRQIGSGHS